MTVPYPIPYTPETPTAVIYAYNELYLTKVNGFWYFTQVTVAQSGSLQERDDNSDFLSISETISTTIRVDKRPNSFIEVIR